MIASRFGRALRRPGSFGLDQAVLRMVVLVAPVVAMFAAFAAADRSPSWVVLPVLFVASVCAVVPESNVGLFLVLGIAWYWAATVDDLRTPWTFVAAAGLGLFHMSAAASTVAPPAARWSSEMRRRWWGRGAVVLALTAIVWGGQLAMADAGTTGSALLLFVSLVLVAGAALVVRARSLH